MIGLAGIISLAIALLTAQPHAAAAKHKKARAPVAPTTAEKRVAVTPLPRPRPTLAPKRTDGEPATPVATTAADTSADTAAAVSDGQAGAPAGKSSKTKVYSFGAMDVEGKLKTPQLLYFLNRVKLELEMSAPDHRSFMKELEKTAEDPNL